ncbi:hypothetical protein HAX54_050099, partial [Datura stramonium]|nr:hypothetical protein [Datura stramonium]
SRAMLRLCARVAAQAMCSCWFCATLGRLLVQCRAMSADAQQNIECCDRKTSSS